MIAADVSSRRGRTRRWRAGRHLPHARGDLGQVGLGSPTFCGGVTGGTGFPVAAYTSSDELNSAVEDERLSCRVSMRPWGSAERSLVRRSRSSDPPRVIGVPSRAVLRSSFGPERAMSGRRAGLPARRRPARPGRRQARRWPGHSSRSLSNVRNSWSSCRLWPTVNLHKRRRRRRLPRAPPPEVSGPNPRPSHTPGYDCS